MTLPSAESAALNNALWCDAVCRAHRLPTRLDETLWQCSRPTPRFYPNVVTLSRDARVAQMAAIAALARGRLIEGLSVKDSFATLDLASLGFSVLFEATWIARSPVSQVHADPHLRWTAVQTPSQLVAWEAAWWGDADAPYARIFLPALLDDPGVSFVAAMRGNSIIAGGILNRTESPEGAVVGISNFFTAAGEEGAHWWAALATHATRVAPGFPIVGYEMGEALAWAVDAGFTPLHPLRVWARIPNS